MHKSGRAVATDHTHGAQRTKKFLLASAVALSLAAAMVNADDLGSKSFQIAAQPLSTALKAFAAQSDMQLIFSEQDVGKAQTVGVHGDFGPREALQTMLRGTNLEFEFTTNNVVVVRKADARAASRGTGVRRANDDDFMLAQSVASGSSDHEVDASKNLAEVIVTAQKREQRIIDVPISITAVSGEELQQRQITSLEDLTAAVPNLSVQKSGSFYIYEIRGVSNVAGGGPLIGVYLDESDITLPGIQINPITYDLERVEVLRGPQGTLYGGGSAGGTIRFISKNPNLDKFTFDTQLAATVTPGGNPGEQANAVVNIPLIDNQLGVRIGGTFEHDGGWIDQPAANQKNINSRDLTNVRIKGLWQPDSQLSVAATVIINRDDRGLDFSDVNSSRTFTQVLNQPLVPRMQSDYELYSLTTSYDVADTVRILNAFTYLTVDAPMQNYDQVFEALPPPLPVFQAFLPNYNFTDRVMSDELRMSSIGSGPWQWTLGSYFRRATEVSDGPKLYIDLLGPPGTPLPTPSPLEGNSKTKSWSVFGDTSYQLWDRLTLGAGVRYFQDKKSSTLPPNSADFHSIDPRVYAQYKLVPEVSIYTSAAKGFRSGGLNAVGLPTFKPESLWTYELGTKMSLLEGSLNIDTALFLSNYADYIIFGVDPRTANNIYSNAGKARIKGVETNVAWRVLPQWRLEARGNYVDAKFTSIAAGNSPYVEGDVLDGVPRYQFTLSAQHDFTLAAKPAFARVDYSQQAEITMRSRFFNGPSGGPTPWYHAESGVVKLLGLHTDLQWSDSLSFGFFAQNLLNNQAYVSPLWFNQEGVRSRPRTFGVEFKASFE